MKLRKVQVDHRARYEARMKRGGGKVVHLSATAGQSDPRRDVPAGALDSEPSPEFAAEVAEEYSRLLALLNDRELQYVAARKMEGYTTKEIAKQVGKEVATVERMLQRIREIWKGEVAGDASQDR